MDEIIAGHNVSFITEVARPSIRGQPLYKWTEIVDRNNSWSQCVLYSEVAIPPIRGQPLYKWTEIIAGPSVSFIQK